MHALNQDAHKIFDEIKKHFFENCRFYFSVLRSQYFLKEGQVQSDCSLGGRSL